MKLALMVGLFGAMGAITRLFCTKWLGTTGSFPTGTLAVNMIGCILLGILMGWTLTTNNMPEHWKIPLATGFLGSLTTFSTFAVESIRLIEGGHYKAAFLYLATHLIIGLFMALIGLWLGRRWA